MRSYLLGLFLALPACGARSAIEIGFESGGSLSDSRGSQSSAGGATGGAAIAEAAGSTSGGAAVLTSSAGSVQAAAGAEAAGTAGAAAKPMVAKAISAGSDSSCGLQENGTVWCWGRNDSGQLGNGTTTQSSAPVQVIGIDDAIAISAGGAWIAEHRGTDFYPFNCAVLRDGRVQCWGNVPGSEKPSAVPVFVPGLEHAVAVAGGHMHACALLKDGSIQCWGSAEWRSPSNSSMPSSEAPATVLGLGNATAVVGLGTTFSCAGSSEGSVECWGPHTVALGAAAMDWTPLEIPIAGRARAGGIAAGYERACTVLSDGGVQCWHGVGSDPPVTVPGLHSATAVSVGRDHTCALAEGGTIECWGEKELGNDISGQIGDRGLVMDDRQPLTISGIRDAIAVSAGDSYTCFLLRDGSAWCWGNNRYGQLGDGADDSVRRERNITPVRVRGF